MQRLLQSLTKRHTLGPIVMDISELIRIEEPRKFDEVRAKQKKLSEVTDMIHAAHNFHRCVSNGSKKDLTVTKNQDNVLSLLVGDYLLAQSSVDMASLRHPRTVSLVARCLEDYTRGEFLKLQLIESLQTAHVLRLADLQNAIKQYAELTCGSLLSNSCLSAVLLAGHTDESDTLANLVQSFGLYTGSAQRFIEMLYCPNEDDKNFISLLPMPTKHLGEFCRQYLEKSINALRQLPEGRTQSSLKGALDKMSQRNNLSDT
jgi:geranylgeranyl pyrophosphate synthase